MTERNFLAWLRSTALQPQAGAWVPSEESVPYVLASGELVVVYQPVVDLSTGDVFAYEALARSTSPDYRSPPQLFESAIRAGTCGALGRLLREIAIRECPNARLFINIHPYELHEGWLVRPDDPIFRHEAEVYLEVTESVPLTHVGLCHDVLAELRHKQIRVAIDDLGAGYSNLRYIADLCPDIVKIDRGLIANLAREPRLQTLLASLVRLCTDLGARVVGEGVETEEESHAVRDAGVHYGQGFYYARPANPRPALTCDEIPIHSGIRSIAGLIKKKVGQSR